MNYGGLRIVGALFFAAPIGAGMTGAAYFAVLPFTGLLLLWYLVMRAEPFGNGAAFILPTVMLHFAIASMLLGMGVLLRALLGIEAEAPLVAWLVLGLAALALGRLIWQPQKAAEFEGLLEIALKKLNEFANDAEEILDNDPDLPLHHPTPAESEALSVAFEKLDALPTEDTGEDAMLEALQPLEVSVRSHIQFEAFLERAERKATRRDRHAVLLLASDGGHAWAELGNGRMAAVFEQIVEAADTATLALFISHAWVLIEDFPATWIDMPEIPRLVDIANQIEGAHPELADGLVRLAAQIEDTARELGDE